MLGTVFVFSVLALLIFVGYRRHGRGHKPREYNSSSDSPVEVSSKKELEEALSQGKGAIVSKKDLQKLLGGAGDELADKLSTSEANESDSSDRKEPREEDPVRLLRSPDQVARDAAVTRLAESGNPTATAALVEALQESRAAEKRQQLGRSEQDIQRRILKALGEFGDVSAMPALYECLPFSGKRRKFGGIGEFAKDALFGIAARHPDEARQWLLERLYADGEYRSRAGAVAMALAKASAPEAVEAIRVTLRGDHDAEKQVEMIRVLGALRQARAVAIIVDQWTELHGGLDVVEEVLGSLVPTVLPELTLDILFAMATMLPAVSKSLDRDPGGTGIVFMDGVRGAALDELDSRDFEFDDARAEMGSDDSVLPEYERILDPLTSVLVRDKRSRELGSTGDNAKPGLRAEKQEAKMLSFLQGRGNRLPVQYWLQILRLPVGLPLAYTVRQWLHSVPQLGRRSNSAAPPTYGENIGIVNKETFGCEGCRSERSLKQDGIGSAYSPISGAPPGGLSTKTPYKCTDCEARWSHEESFDAASTWVPVFELDRTWNTGIVGRVPLVVGTSDQWFEVSIEGGSDHTTTVETWVSDVQDQEPRKCTVSAGQTTTVHCQRAEIVGPVGAHGSYSVERLAPPREASQ